MNAFLRFVLVFFCLAFLTTALPLGNEEVPLQMSKRLSNEALIRLLMKHRNSGGFDIKRNVKRARDLERRSIDDDFSNCFLSPVQCMLPGSR